MTKKSLLALAAVAVGASLMAVPASADAENGIIRIQFGENYRSYKNDELRRRVWDLERAVAQMQAKIYQLETMPAPVVVQPPPPTPWTCRVSAFGKTYVKTMPTRSEAESYVLKTCSEAHNEMFCEKIECGQ